MKIVVVPDVEMAISLLRAGLIHPGEDWVSPTMIEDGWLRGRRVESWRPVMNWPLPRHDREALERWLDSPGEPKVLPDEVVAELNMSLTL